MLEIGPGTGYYTLELAAWVGDQGTVEVFDIQQEMLDHTIRAARERGLWNVNPTRGDAQQLGLGRRQLRCRDPDHRAR